MPKVSLTEMERLTKKGAQLLKERDAMWLPKWKDLRDYLSPRDGQFEGDEENDGKRRDRKINNTKPLRSMSNLAAGMTSGMTSQARPWFELAAPEGIPDTIAVRQWLYDVQEAIRAVHAKSNLYSVLPQVYRSQGVYGTGVMAGLPDSKNTLRFYHYPCGTYALDTNARGQVDTFYREYKMTPRQMADQFGMDNLCKSTQEMAKRGELTRVSVCHLIEPNPDADMRKVDNLSMSWKSTYWEKGKSEGMVLRQSGFRSFPIMAPRWDVNGTNVYGTGPGDVILGKAKELQLLEADKMRIVQQLARPALTAPISIRGQQANLVPGGITWLPDQLVGQGMQPAYTPDPAALPNVRAEIDACEQAIREASYEDLFLLISQSDGTMTAYEVAQRKEEKMLMLGPVVERNNDELLDPLIALTFSVLYQESVPYWQGLLPGTPPLPPPPEELEGVPVRVEFISVLAQAQKGQSVGTIERAIQFTGSLMAAGFPEAGDKLDFDAAQDEYYEAIGAPPTILRDAEATGSIRQGRAAAAAQQAGMEQGMALAQGAKTLAETPTTGDTALSAMIQAAQ